MKHEPRHEYDCSRCKYGWCCGLLCSCELHRFGAPKAPRVVADAVEWFQEKWRKGKRAQAHKRMKSTFDMWTTARKGRK